jgi:hypothetical protein
VRASPVRALTSPNKSAAKQHPASYGGVSIWLQLNIKSFPTATGNTVPRAASPIGCRDLLSGNYITISSPGSATAVQKSVGQLTTIIYHHCGRPRLWIVVPPAEHSKLESRIREIFRDKLGEGCCSQFVKHLSLWITPDLLREWGVVFTQVLQQEKQTLFLFPSSYYCGMSTGFSIVETKAIAGPRWELNGYRFCGPSYPLCIAAQPNCVVFTLSQRAIDGKQTTGFVVSGAGLGYDRCYGCSGCHEGKE